MIAHQLEMVARCKKTIFAAGTTDPESHIAMTGLLDRAALAQMRDKGATGVICGRLIDKNGAPMPAPIEDRMIGVSLDQMREKEVGILVSAGVERIPAARAAMLGGYVTHLVTCSTSAALLLENPQ